MLRTILNLDKVYLYFLNKILLLEAINFIWPVIDGYYMFVIKL